MDIGGIPIHISHFVPRGIVYLIGDPASAPTGFHMSPDTWMEMRYNARHGEQVGRFGVELYRRTKARLKANDERERLSR